MVNMLVHAVQIARSVCTAAVKVNSGHACLSFTLCCHSNSVTSGRVTGAQGIEEVLRAKQESHVKQFLLTEVALQAGHAAQEHIHTLAADLQG